MPMKKSEFRECDTYAARIAALRPLPKETLKSLREYYREMGCLCYENHDMGLYFINDPDDYWIEILPLKR